MKIESVTIEKLIKDPVNARKHNDKNIEAIKGSLAKFGQQKPIVVNKDNVVVAGNGTLEAARQLGWKEINVVRTELTGTDITAFGLADNRTSELAEWDLDVLPELLASLQDLDFDLSSIGFDADDLNKMMPQEVEPGLTDDDAVPENVETRCKPGDLWILGNHRLLCGDSTNVQHVERLMDEQNAELCFTSPPYADQREYNGDKEISTEYLATFIRAAYGFCHYFSINLGVSRKNNEVNPYWDDYIKEAKNCGLKFLSWNVWDKGECGSIGNQTAMFGISHEWILFFGKERKDLNLTVANKSAGERANHTSNRQSDGSIKQSKERIVADFSQLKTVYSVTAQKARDGIDHPARFPVEFALGYIEACTHSNEIVYEPFSGSGSTLIACEKTNRKCYACEIDPHYVTVAVKRWMDFTGKMAYLELEDGSKKPFSEC